MTDPVAEDGAHFLMDLSTLVEEKSNRFDLNENTLIMAMRADLDNNKATKPGVSPMELGVAKLKVDSADVESCLTHVEYGVSCYHAYDVRVNDQHANTDHTRVQ